MANVYLSVHNTLNKVYCIVVEWCIFKNDELILPSFNEALKYNYDHQVLNCWFYHSLFFTCIINDVLESVTNFGIKLYSRNFSCFIFFNITICQSLSNVTSLADHVSRQISTS